MSGCGTDTGTGTGCENSEPFALRSIDDSMWPEFEVGAVIIIDPGGVLKDGVYIVADHDNEPIFRQLVIHEGKRYLKPVNDLYPTLELQDDAKIHGVVIQKYHERKRTHYDR
ncbi:MAG: S24 family peptidase [Gammaproteobacteria bacterium]|nr:S24 family peptidase [Gammaproteobacteria bacterium]MDH5593610.1 S24 family peptidase [Gammaproteobacteria bacterium]MDH5613597.1 S24 family peptidase [Gammaproteobacteria bacterium]